MPLGKIIKATDNYLRRLPSALTRGRVVFHSISVFCTGGFSTFPEGLSTSAGFLTVNLVFVSLIDTGDRASLF